MGSVLIVEILVDPAPGLPDPGSEWVVLRNVSGGMITMRGWSLADSQGRTELPAIDLPAGSSVVIAANEASGAGLPPADQQVMLAGRIGNGLNNLGDSLVLIDGSMAEIDGVSWGSDRSVSDPPAVLSAPGVPLRRLGIQDTNTADDWRVPAIPTVPVPSPTLILIPSATPVQEVAARMPADADTGAGTPVLLPTAAAVNPSGMVAVGAGVSGMADPAHDVVMSEIAPEAGWIELYNRGAQAIDLNGWSLAETQGTATLLLSNLPAIPVHGFAVIKADAFQLARLDRDLVLRRPDGSVADVVSVREVTPGLSLSRYPVHGGGWNANTPLTAGSLNLPPDIIEQPPARDLTADAHESAEASPTEPNSRSTRRWLLPVLLCLVAVSLLGLIWRRVSGAPPTVP